MKVWKWIAVISVGLVFSGSCVADVLVPGWDGDADTTSVYYSFQTDTNPPVPDTVTNSYGAVQSQLLPGALSGGWADPTDPFGLTRADGTGTWNINDDGYIAYQVPFSDGSLSLYTLELVIDVIAYQGITALPDIAVSGTVLEHDLYQFLEEPDSEFPGANWMHQVWTGTVQVASSSIISVDLTGAASQGSVLDRVSIYTRVIPEPTAISLILLSSGFALVIKRRLS